MSHISGKSLYSHFNNFFSVQPEMYNFDLDTGCEIEDQSCLDFQGSHHEENNLAFKLILIYPHENITVFSNKLVIRNKDKDCKNLNPFDFSKPLTQNYIFVVIGVLIFIAFSALIIYRIVAPG